MKLSDARFRTAMHEASWQEAILKAGGLPSTISDGLDRLSSLLDQHHAAMVAGDERQTMTLRERMWALRAVMAGGFGLEREGDIESVVTAEPDQEPRWGGAGSWVVEGRHVAARVKMYGVFGLDARASYWFGFEAFAVDACRGFLSETGYRLFAGLRDRVRPAEGPAAFVRGILDRHVEESMGGVLVSVTRPRVEDDPRKVRVPGTRIAWTGLGGWLEETHRLIRQQRPSSAFYRRADSLHRSLEIRDIRACRDRETLEAVDALLKRQSGALHGPSHSLSRAEIGRLRAEIHNQLRRLETGSIDRPARAKGPKLDPRRIPDDRLDLLIQHHADMRTVEHLRAEKARRDSKRSAA